MYDLTFIKAVLTSYYYGKMAEILSYMCLLFSKYRDLLCMNG